MSGTPLTDTAGSDQQRTQRDSTHEHALSAIDETPPLSLDVVFELLRVNRRREVLWYLQANEGVARLDELAEYIAAKENGVEEAALTSTQRKRVYIGLYQCHLPKMHDAGVIAYDQPRGTLELRAAAQQLYPYLTLDPLGEPVPESGTLQRVWAKLRS